MPERLFDAAAAAERLGLCLGTLAKWRLRGYGPRYLKLGSRVRYREADIDEWLAAQARRSTSDLGRSEVA